MTEWTGNDEVLAANMEVVGQLSCKELKLWVAVMLQDADPRRLPQYLWYNHIFSERGPNGWPVVSPDLKLIFLDFAKTKLKHCP